MILTQEKINSFRTNIETKKAGVYKKFGFLNHLENTEILNRIISELRPLPLQKAKDQHFVRKNEYIMFVKEIGYWE